MEFNQRTTQRELLKLSPLLLLGGVAMPAVREYLLESGVAWSCGYIHRRATMEPGEQAVAEGYAPCTRCMKEPRDR